MKKESPLLLHIPHSSTVIPEAYINIYTDRSLLLRELRCMTDFFTDELFQSDDTRIIFPVSRLLCDVERFREPSMESMTKRGMWICYTHCSDGSLLAKTNELHIQRILNRYYDAHHRRFFELADEKHKALGHVLIVDCHSFSSTPLPHEPSQKTMRPDICIGTDSYHTPEGLTQRLELCFRDQGFCVERNDPFAGTIVPMQFYRKNPFVHSIMIEVNRKLYMDETTTRKAASFPRVTMALQEALTVCRCFLMQCNENP